MADSAITADTNTAKAGEGMAELFERTAQSIRYPRVGDVVEGTIISLSKNEVHIDIPRVGLGVVRGPELFEASDMFTNLKIGDPVFASVLEQENKHGEMELSFKEAHQEKAWATLDQHMKDQEIISTKIISANKGGLIVQIEGIVGFLPVSQLSAEHYPRVENGDKNQILQHLQSFVGESLRVQVITADPKEDKLIVSEKAIRSDEQKAKMETLKVGDTVEGDISGVVGFGAFIKFEGLEGLIHISELAWQRIDDPHDIVKVGDHVKAQIISIDEGKISLSLKKLKEDPWKKAAERYQVGQVVKGKVLKVETFGAFVELDKDIHGLAHIAELSSKPVKSVADILKTNDEREFKIISIEPNDHRLGLSIKALEQKTEEQPAAASEEKKADEPTTEEKK